MKILWVDACTGNEAVSRTYGLCRVFGEEYQKQRPRCEITHLRLFEAGISYLTPTLVQKRDRLLSEGRLEHPMFGYARDFAGADRILIGAPYWDLSFPAVLKCYFEQISVCGITFRYTPAGAEGLCKAAKLLYITTSGGYIGGADFGGDYIKGLCSLYGIPQFECVSAQGLDIEGSDIRGILAEAARQLRRKVLDW